MARSPRGSGTPRRPRVEARTPRESVASRPTEAPARTLDARRNEVTASRFRIFIAALSHIHNRFGVEFSGA
jgi:hypothetical protein